MNASNHKYDDKETEGSPVEVCFSGLEGLLHPKSLGVFCYLNHLL